VLEGGLQVLSGVDGERLRVYQVVFLIEPLVELFLIVIILEQLILIFFCESSSHMNASFCISPSLLSLSVLLAPSPYLSLLFSLCLSLSKTQHIHSLSPSQPSSPPSLLTLSLSPRCNSRSPLTWSMSLFLSISSCLPRFLVG
jgi:hypothetical protein